MSPECFPGELHKNFFGELIGTFIIVFFGCGAVAVTVIFSSHVGLFQVAAIWGLGVTLAIYVTRHLSCAHLNPAVSVAMLLAGRMAFRKLPVYLAAQFTGAFLGACAVYALFYSSITRYESLHGIIRGTPESMKTAMIFGEFYANAGAGVSISIFNAFIAEALGTFLLVFIIFALTDGCNVGRPDDTLTPLFIGLTVSAIICVIAPLTQAGLNPARDLSPRIFAFLAGWGPASLPDHNFGFLTVYVIGPLTGAGMASLLTRMLQPLMVPDSCE
jgi:glycerol uptake facilitator protein